MGRRRWLVVFGVIGLLLRAGDRRNEECPNTDTKARFEAPGTRGAWEERRARLQGQILRAAGLAPMPRGGPLKPLVVKKLDRDGYTIESVALETRPGYWVGGNLYRPAAAGRHPAVLVPHGHWTYGRLEHQPLYSGPSLGITLAKNGFVAFVYDMVGYNDTAQTPHDFKNAELEAWSFTPLGLQLWNSMRVVDYLSGLPDVDAAKIGVTGASGGGTQTFLLAAVDGRIAAAAPVNMVSGIMQGGCVCENAPGLRIGTNNIEIAALMAPKPMLVVAATGDWTRNVPREEYPAIQKVYDLYGARGQVEMVQIEAPHNYQKESREAVYEFFRKTFLPGAGAIKEKGIKVERLQDMLVFWGEARPAGARRFEELFAEWKAESRAQTRAMSGEQLRAGFAAALGVGAGLEGGPVRYQYFAGAGKPLVYVHPEGLEAGLRATAEARRAGRAVVVVEAFQTGGSVAARDRKHEHFLTFNWSDDAARVQDVAAAAQFLKEKTGQRVEVAGTGASQAWALFAAAATGAEYLGEAAELASPGVERAGGVEGALRAVGR